MSGVKERTVVEEKNCDHTTEESGGEIDEKKLLRKIDLHLLPPLSLLFLLSFLDRNNGNSLSLFLTSSSFSFSRKRSHRRSGHRSTHEYVSSHRPGQNVPYRRSKQAGDQFLTTLTVYFIGYVLFEIPCNIALKLTTPRFWLPTLTLTWGIICTLMGVTRNFPGFLAVRFFLGVVESGFFPGAIFYLSMWYKRSELYYRIALFFSAPSAAGAFGGIS